MTPPPLRLRPNITPKEFVEAVQVIGVGEKYAWPLETLTSFPAIAGLFEPIPEPMSDEDYMMQREADSRAAAERESIFFCRKCGGLAACWCPQPVSSALFAPASEPEPTLARLERAAAKFGAAPDTVEIAGCQYPAPPVLEERDREEVQVTLDTLALTDEKAAQRHEQSIQGTNRNVPWSVVRDTLKGREDHAQTPCPKCGETDYGDPHAIGDCLHLMRDTTRFCRREVARLEAIVAAQDKVVEVQAKVIFQLSQLVANIPNDWKPMQAARAALAKAKEAHP
jgi:hypothetical protein